MEEYSYFISDIFGNLVMVDYRQFKEFFNIFEHTFPDFYCDTHLNKVVPHYEHKNYYHDGKVYCCVIRDLDFIPFS